MKNPHIALLKKQVKKLDSPEFDLEAWKVSTQLLLGQIFGTFDPKTVAIRDLKIDYSSTMLRDSNADYKPLETCKKKGHEVLELAVDELEMAILPESELRQLVDAGDKEGVLNYLKKQKKEELIDLISTILMK
jgi:hypothetical protein